MKIFCLILSFYALLLSADLNCLFINEEQSLVCSDKHCEKELKHLTSCNETVEKAQKKDQKEDQTESNDCCSPFVICNHCSISPFPVKLFLMQEPSSVKVQKMPIHHFFLHSEYSTSIWQPPKTS
ncbi:hypothetical protein BH10BAC5_BH10BAC5_27410 [soil metagenome]